MSSLRNGGRADAMAPREHIYGYSVLVLSAIIWGTEAILVKLCYSGGFSVAGLLSLRYLAALPVFVLILKIRGEPLKPPPALLIPMLKLSANVLAGVVTLYLALALLPPTLAILFFYAYPAFTSLLYLWFKRGPLGAPRLLALLISALGLILLFWSSQAGLSGWGVACALASALLQAVKLFQTASLLPRISAARLNFFTALTTAIAASLFWAAQAAFSAGGWGIAAISGPAWLYLLALGMIVTVFANLFMTLGIHYVGALDTSLVLLLEPLTTAALAFFIFGDLLNPWQTVGGLLILLAVALPAAANLRPAKNYKKEG